MTSRSKVPDRGDLVYVDFDPQAGHEQAGRRPAVILTPQVYNAKVGLALVCPITSKPKGYPFEVMIPTGKKIRGVILSDQIKSIDWSSRRADIVDRVDAGTIEAVLERIQLLLDTKGTK